MGQLLIRLTVPLSKHADDTDTALMFYQWLPIGEEHGIHYRKEQYELLLWLDENCTTRAPGLTIEDILRWDNITVYCIYADVTVKNVEEGPYMRNRDFRRMPTPDEEALAERNEEHGRAVLSFVSEGLNHLLTFARSEKGQYWLTAYRIDLDNTSSYAVHFGAKARVGDGEWFHWWPSQVHRGGVITVGDTRRYLTANDWWNAREFVAQDRRSTLALELLAGAEYLAEAGQDRAALTEMVSALEVAISAFARSPHADKLYDGRLRERLGLETLPKVVQNLGLTGSVALVLPLLLPENEVSFQVLARCRNAINVQNNIVHSGQRGVEPELLTESRRAIRSLCETLLRLSQVG